VQARTGCVSAAPPRDANRDAPQQARRHARTQARGAAAATHRHSGRATRRGGADPAVWLRICNSGGRAQVCAVAGILLARRDATPGRGAAPREALRARGDAVQPRQPHARRRRSRRRCLLPGRARTQTPLLPPPSRQRAAPPDRRAVHAHAPAALHFA
jgi:hypothetical protein